MAIITSYIVTETINLIDTFSNRSFDEMSFDSRVTYVFVGTVAGFDIWQVNHHRPEIVITGWVGSTLKGEYYIKDWDAVHGEILGATQEAAYHNPCAETFAAYDEASAYLFA